jgi:hypothetical protein
MLEIGDQPNSERTEPVPPRSYFVRSHQTVDEILAGEEKAERQEVVLLKFFVLYGRGACWTPSEIHARPQFQRWPLTSVRRCLTVLTSKGELTHWPGDRRPSVKPEGGLESTWSLRDKSADDLGLRNETPTP